MRHLRRRGNCQRGWPLLSPHSQKAGALPFSRSLREGGAFRGLSVTARLVDFVFQVAQGLFVPHGGSWTTCAATQCNAGWSRVLRIGRGAVPGAMPPNKLSSRAEHQVCAANLMRSRGTLCIVCASRASVMKVTHSVAVETQGPSTSLGKTGIEQVGRVSSHRPRSRRKP